MAICVPSWLSSLERSEALRMKTTNRKVDGCSTAAIVVPVIDSIHICTALWVTDNFTTLLRCAVVAVCVDVVRLFPSAQSVTAAAPANRPAHRAPSERSSSFANPCPQSTSPQPTALPSNIPPTSPPQCPSPHAFFVWAQDPKYRPRVLAPANHDLAVAVTFQILFSCCAFKRLNAGAK